MGVTRMWYFSETTGKIETWNLPPWILVVVVLVLIGTTGCEAVNDWAEAETLRRDTINKQELQELTRLETGLVSAAGEADAKRIEAEGWKAIMMSLSRRVDSETKRDKRESAAVYALIVVVVVVVVGGGYLIYRQQQIQQAGCVGSTGGKRAHCGSHAA